jgi:hypothetical protein
VNRGSSEREVNVFVQKRLVQNMIFPASSMCEVIKETGRGMVTCVFTHFCNMGSKCVCTKASPLGRSVFTTFL